MLKISALVSSISQDFRVATRFAKESGLDGLDLDVVWGQPVEKIASSEDAKSLQKVLKKEGITVFCLATTIFKNWIDSEESVRDDLRCLQKCLDLAENLNSPLIRCYSFRRSENSEAYLPRLIDHLGAAAEISGKRGITLGIQNDSMTLLGTGERVAKVLHSIGNPHLRSIWDPCAALHDMDFPEIPYPDGYRFLQPFITHVMLGDVDRHKFRGSLCEVEFGEGLIDYRKQIKALKEEGYTSAVSIATQWHPGMDWDTSLDEADFTEQGGKEALLICLANLTKMMN